MWVLNVYSILTTSSHFIFIADPIALTAEFLGLGSRSNPTTMTNSILNLGGVGVVSATDSSNKSGSVIGNNMVLGGTGTGHVGSGGSSNNGIISSSNVVTGIAATNIDVLNCNSSNANALAAAYMPLTPSSTQSSISPGTSTAGNSYDMFQVSIPRTIDLYNKIQDNIFT